ncbi:MULTISPECIES: sulfite exporter TauE/SafE family protein [Sphingopyxis]|uniref:sulfite exporter TauE/SafE family protein n=1 Tax=Sphingopyxis TaxID=165697 RepID=UPI001648CE5D|nr:MULTISPECIES: sulfite exporter TauE/SafE family protein [Sphingopyxis]QXF11411.1 sulfite exporter TauE/SafE family protein [Sphingopyxis terrae subsp. terrae]
MQALLNPDMAMLAAMMLLTGAVGGVIAGMLGVGGGIVIVPVLDLVLAALGIDSSVRMHVAVATSLATIIPTAISSSRAHEAKGAVDHDQLRRWGVAIFLGAIAGVLLASRVSGDVLSAVFGIVALLVAVKMLLPLERKHIAETMPGGVVGQAIPFAIGGISSMMGIGGGTLSVPVMTLFNVPIHRAVGTAALFGLLISAPAAVAFVVTGWHVEGLPPGSLGYVNLIGLAVIGPATFLTAPWGARIAHALSKRQLSILFGLFLTVVAVRMLIRAFG